MKQNKFSLGNKLLVVGAAVLLIAVVCVNAVQRFGTDLSTSISYGLEKGLISTSKDTKLFAASGAGLQQAIYYLNDTGGTVYLPSSTLTLSSCIRVENKNNVSISGYGCTIKAVDNYAGYYTDGYYMFWVDDSTNINFEGFSLDSNSPVHANDVITMRILGTSDDIFLNNVGFNGSIHGDIYISGDVGTVDLFGCRFSDFAGGPTNAYSVFCSGVKHFNVIQCKWENMHFYGHKYNQCLYLSGDVNSTYVVDSCVFNNVGIIAAPRYGFFSMSNCVGNNMNVSVLASIGTPFCVISNCRFYNITGVPGVNRYGIGIASGTAHIKDCVLKGKSGATGAYQGIQLRYASTSNCVVENNIIEGFVIDGCGINIATTEGNHTIRNNKIIGNTLVLVDAIKSEGNSYPSFAYGNIFSNKASSGNLYDNDDGMLIVLENYSVFRTENISSTFLTAGFCWYDVTAHKLYVYEGAGVWKSSTFT